MTESYIESSDAELETEIIGFLRLHAVKLIKAPIAAGLAGFSVWVLSGSIIKAFVVAAICLVLSAFNTYRRFLEPLVFWGFAFAVIHWCDADLLTRAKSLFF
jgi:hypothetical protein